jgi:uridylate kinase
LCSCAPLPTKGIEIAIVIGGGNIFRSCGTAMEWIRVNDYMGMLILVINGIALQGALEDKGTKTVYKPH